MKPKLPKKQELNKKVIRSHKMSYHGKNIFFERHKEDIVSFFMALLCLGLFVLFPASGSSQQITSGFFFLVLLPLLYLKFILKKNLRDLGLQLGEWRTGLLFSAIYLATASFVFFLLFRYTSFPQEYRLPTFAAINFWYFLFYEFFIVGIFAALYEFFFRGFIMLNLFKKSGFYSVFYQFFAFFLFFAVTENMNWNNAPLLTAAFFSGLTTFKGRSLLYSLSTTLIFFLVLDALIIRFS